MTGVLQGRVALITGTGGGVGREAALRFAAAGATVVGCDTDQELNEETVAAVTAAGGAMTGTGPIDLADPSEAAAWVEAAAAAHGRIDIVYNNAAGVVFEPIETMSADGWYFTIRNELDLVFFVTQAAWPHLAKQGGVIINTGSVQGLIGRRTQPGIAHAATKGAVVAMTRQFAAEGAPHGIRSVCISPGAIETPTTAPWFAVPEIRNAVLDSQLVNRIGQPADVAELAVFLASDAAGFMSGSNIVLDGGVTSV